MFYKFTQLAVICSTVLCMCLGTNAQTPLAQQHINRYSLLQPYVPEGILIDRSPLSLFRHRDGIDPDKFSLNQSDTATFQDFVDYYRLFFYASYQSSRFPWLPDTLDQLAAQQAYGATYQLPALQRQKENDIVLAGMRFQYREIAANAIDCFYVYYHEPIDKYRLGIGNYALYDTVWLDTTFTNYTIVNTSIPLNTQAALAQWSVVRDFFMISADVQTAYIQPGQALKVKVPSNLFFGSLLGVVLQMDFDDGLGFRNVSVGNTYSVNYQNDGTKYIRARLLNGDGAVLTNQSAITSFNLGILRMGAPNATIISGHAYCSAMQDIPMGEGVAFIKYSPQSQGKLMKPFVLVEGFESNSYEKGSNVYVPGDFGGFGDLSWSSISSGNFTNQLAHVAPITDFLDSLNRAGYDIVFVDFATNHGAIESNAKALISIMGALNQQLQANGSTEHIELIGASMGGLIARIALREMELSGCCHNVKLFTTYATPHLGANVPLSLQAGLKDMIERHSLLDEIQVQRERFQFVLNSPAARQMLIYHIEPGAAAERNAFQSYLQQIGLPQEARKMAVTNGSVIGEAQKVSEALNAPFIIPGSQFYLVSAEAWVPTTFPIPLNQWSYRAAQTNGMYILRSEGFILPHSPSAPSNQLYYKGGKDLISNAFDITDAYLTYLKGAVKLFRITKSTAVAMASQPQFAPAILAAGAIRIATHSVLVSIDLTAKFHDNIQDNVNGAKLLYAGFPTLGVDYAPGDHTGRSTVFVKGFFSNRSVNSLHTYVSTVSSINANYPIMSPLTALQFSFQNSFKEFEGVISMFDAPDANLYNTKHVMVNQHLSNKIRLNQLSSRSSTYFHSIGNNISFNIGRPFDNIVINSIMNSDVEIMSGTFINEKLAVNNNDVLAYGFSGQGIPHSIIPLPNSHFIAKTMSYNCDSVNVLIGNGGVFELGELLPGVLMTAEARFRDASTLTLGNGSTLRVNNKSTLVIEPGAKLIIHPGAQIILEGDSAIIDIQGDVILMDQAVFSFSGGGFIRVNQGTAAHPTGTWTMASTSRIQWAGANRQDLIAEVIGQWRIPTTQGTVKLTSGQVFMRENATMDFHNQVDMVGVLVTGNLAERHGGLHLHGQAQVNLTQSEFRNGNFGIVAYLLEYQNGLTLNTVSLNNNVVGLQTHGKAVNLINCVGRFNSTFWQALDIEGFSRVRNCRITQGTKGIDVMGQNGARLDIISTVIDSNFNAVFSFGNLQLRAYCSSFSNNSYGFYSGNTHVLVGGGANNKFKNNDIAIYLEEVDNLYIQQGENDFSGSNWYITGMFSGIASNHLQQLPNVTGYFLNIKNNKMPLVAQTLPIDLLDYDGNPVYPHDWTFMSSVPVACVKTTDAAYEAYLLSTLNSSIQVYMNGQQVNLGSALSEAIELVSKEEVVINPSDLTALNRFNQIFSSLRSQSLAGFSPAERTVLAFGLERMIEALSNAYRYSLLQAARADKFYPLSSEINWVLDELNFRIQHANNLFYVDQNELKMKKAHVYRTGEYYEQAIDVLHDVQLSADFGSDVQIQADYWLCVCAAEMELVSGTITSTEFESMRAPCLLLIPEMRRPGRVWNPFELITKIEASPEVVLYPNPYKGAVRLKQTADNGASKVRVYTAEGNLVITFEWPSSYEELILDEPGLAAGVYQVRVSFEGGQETHLRWIKL